MKSLTITVNEHEAELIVDALGEELFYLNQRIQYLNLRLEAESPCPSKTQLQKWRETYISKRDRAQKLLESIKALI